MSWQGKILGGSLGSFFGPWGAAVGATAGHYLIDRKKSGPGVERNMRLRLLVLCAAALRQLACADGRCTEKEDKVIRSILEEFNQGIGCPLQPHEIVSMMHESSGISQGLNLLAEAVADEQNLGLTSLTWLWRVAVCDRDPAEAEIALIERYAARLGLGSEQVGRAGALYARQSQNMSSRERQAACALLEVPYNANATQIKTAYRNLSHIYHPDKHNHLEPAIMALAAERFNQIKNAYELLCGIGCNELFALAPNAAQLLPAASQADKPVRCFYCRTRVGLPCVEKIPSARCPLCQTLLAFEEGLAVQLARG